MPSPSVDQLKRAIAIREQISKLEAELSSILGGDAAPTGKRRYTKKATGGESSAGGAPKKGKRAMSEEGRARIIAAQKARWAKLKKEKK